MFLFASCAKHKPEIRIGFSHDDHNIGLWGNLLYEEVENELRLYNDYNITLLNKEAHGSIEKQNQDLIDLVHSRIDVLIIFTIDANATTPIVEKIYDMGIPVIVVDRKLNTTKYNVFISNDNIKIGYEAGIYALHKLKNKGKILEICGTKSSSTANDRSFGFNEAIKKLSGQTSNVKIYGNWVIEVTQNKVDSILKTGFVPDLIYSHTDVMALSARNVCDKYNINPIIVGIDGLPNKNGGIDMILKKQIDATFYNLPGGDKAVQSAISLVQKKFVPKRIILKTFPIDLTNAESIKVGYEIQLEQFDKIKNQQLLIGKMTGIIESQTLLIYLSVAFILLLVLVVFSTLFYLKQKQRFITLIKDQKDKIEQQIEEERSLTDQLLHSHKLLQCQSQEILLKNEYLEKYRTQLEQLVQERTKELESALVKAQESDNLKTSFLSNLSHEIRTPLNSIVGFSHLLKTNNYNWLEDSKLRNSVIESSNQLLDSITQIVEMAKLSTKQIEFKYSIISAEQLFKEIISDSSDFVKQKLKYNNSLIKFTVLTPPNVLIKTDILYLKQVLNYMLDNAFKFTFKGSIQIGLAVENKYNARFFVNDTGIGIKKENHKYIFEKFRKIEDDNTVLFRGIGLGLAISKQIVEMLGGSISVKSEIKVGSEFSIYFPNILKTKELNQISSNNTTKKEIKNKSILIAEDEDSNYIYIETILNHRNAIIHRAINGQEAVSFCLNNRPDIILMDIKMPVMGGIEAFKAIRNIYPDIPILAITAYSLINEEQQIIEVGFNGYLSKPFKPELLYSMIEENII